MKLSTKITKLDIISLDQNEIFALAREIADGLNRASFADISSKAAKRLLWIKPLKVLDSTKITELTPDLDSAARLIGALATVLQEPEDDGEAI